MGHHIHYSPEVRRILFSRRVGCIRRVFNAMLVTVRRWSGA